MFYTYALISTKNGKFYFGHTKDLERRILEHKNKKVESTKNYLPIDLIGYEAYRLKSDAERRERFLKTTEGRRLLKRQYKDILNS